VQSRFAVGCLAVCAVAFCGISCGKTRPPIRRDGAIEPREAGAADDSREPGDRSVDANEGRANGDVPALEDGEAQDRDACVPVTCDPRGGRYCGVIGDGCGGVLSCGDCPPLPATIATCSDGVCDYGVAGCMPWTCATATGDAYCGNIGDGCGGRLSCADICPRAGWTCVNGMCVGTEAVCPKLSCTALSGDSYCGQISDGCGGVLTCPGACPKAGWTCDTGVCIGQPDVCAAIVCRPPAGGQYCGLISDGCGGKLACPTDCGDAGGECGLVTPNVCGANEQALPQPSPAPERPRFPSPAPLPAPPPPPPPVPWVQG
jgi:hypothetical protein